MKFLMLAVVASLALSSQASANFKNTLTRVDNQMSGLAKSIGAVKMIAKKHGHHQISAKCDDAMSHLSDAQDSWGGIFSGYLSFPWEARSSPHAARVQTGMSNCGNALEWIYNRPEVQIPDYTQPLSTCQTSYDSCQGGCQSIWDWPSPPGYGPKPSQAAHGVNYRHKRDTSHCPHQETACPITAHTFGFECIDTQTELTSCGGCVTKGQGENCLSIPGADAVGCDHGKCVVFTVMPGFILNNITTRPEQISPKPSV